MVNAKFVAAKINQQSEFVHFGDKTWNQKIDGVLDKIIRANHLIEMEEIQKK